MGRAGGSTGQWGCTTPPLRYQESTVYQCFGDFVLLASANLAYFVDFLSLHHLNAVLWVVDFGLVNYAYWYAVVPVNVEYVFDWWWIIWLMLTKM